MGKNSDFSHKHFASRPPSPNHVLNGAIQKIFFFKVENVHNLLDPPPPLDNVDYFEFGKIWNLITPPPPHPLRLKLG